MSKPDWKDAPPDAEAWGPGSRKYCAGWYKTSLMGQWYFREPHQNYWFATDRPTPYRKRQLERRP